jgi:hypothetical protein
MRATQPSWVLTRRPLMRAAGRATTLAAVLAAVVGAGVSSAATARVARTFTINDTGHLHKTSGHGITINQVLNEQGSASGTISGPIYIHLRVVSPIRVTAEVNIYPHGGSITGSATATFRSSGGVASFNGTMKIVRGSGRYSHASGSGLSFTGTVQRINDAVTVHVSGRMSA